jgi:RimJ/RimL family protein N-acetyltransferase
MNSYKVLIKQIFKSGDFSLVPIRFEDRFDIMQWRNEQIYHLRQAKPLTEENQNAYFENVVARLFEQDMPNQLLFSFLKNDRCIGYGGLVHINWIDWHAEVSFIMDTSLEKNYFNEMWTVFLKLIEKIAFIELRFHKIFTYAFNLRPHLYASLESNGYTEEALLKDHCLFQGKMMDVYIHSKFNSNLYLDKANEDDCLVTYNWVNLPEVREHSFTKDFIPLEMHTKWFSKKIKDDNCLYFILRKGSNAIGSIRFDVTKEKKSGLISYLIDPKVHGNGYGTIILDLLEKELSKNKNMSGYTIVAFVLNNNLPSIKIFTKLDYECFREDQKSLRFEKKICYENRR